MGVTSTEESLCPLSGTCNIPAAVKSLFKECNEFYSSSNENQHAYLPGWVNFNSSYEISEYRKQPSPWSYIDATESIYTRSIWGIFGTYVGGGYIASLGDNMEAAQDIVNNLETNAWFDKYTRASFMEFNVYNPNVNLLSVVSLEFEFTPAAGVVPRYSMFAFTLYRSLNTAYHGFLLCFLLFFLITGGAVYFKAKKLYVQGKEYFTQCWNILQMFFLLFIIVIILMNFARESVMHYFVKLVKRDMSSYIGFGTCAVYDEVLKCLTAAVNFMIIIKFLRFLRFNKSVARMLNTVFCLRKELIFMLLAIFILLMAFISFTTVIFGSTLYGYRNILSALSSLLLLSLNRFDFQEFKESDTVAGLLFFSVHTFIMFFIFFNFVHSVINTVFAEARKTVEVQNLALTRVVKKYIGRHKTLMVEHEKENTQKLTVADTQADVEIWWNYNVKYILESQTKRIDKYLSSLAEEDFEYMVVILVSIRTNINRKDRCC